MSVCFSASMLDMSAASPLGGALYNMLCNEGDGAIWSVESVAFAVLEVAAAAILLYVVVIAVKRVSQSVRKG